ncbi:MAG TPA: hypothetical protein VEJ41_04230, partial [Candidatus Acidoferrales bacterium]|nr:hypothetical protein [Candidatus Acidoferrales bacterium]
TVRSILQLNNAQGAAAQLLVSNDSGKLILADAATSIRVEAGTETNGYGSVKVSGPTGKCIPAIPCMLVGH